MICIRNEFKKDSKSLLKGQRRKIRNAQPETADPKGHLKPQHLHFPRETYVFLTPVGSPASFYTCYQVFPVTSLHVEK